MSAVLGSRCAADAVIIAAWELGWSSRVSLCSSRGKPILLASWWTNPPTFKRPAGRCSLQGSGCKVIPSQAPVPVREWLMEHHQQVQVCHPPSRAHLACGRPSEYLLVMHEPRACITAREVKFSDAINSRPWTCQMNSITISNSTPHRCSEILHHIYCLGATCIKRTA